MPGAPKVRLKNLGPFGREIPDTPFTVAVGGEVDVIPELAGEAPGPWMVVPVDADGQPVVPDGDQHRWQPVEAGAVTDGQHLAEHAGVLCRMESRHPGSGLLAQEDAWAVVVPAPVKGGSKTVEG